LTKPIDRGKLLHVLGKYLKVSAESIISLTENSVLPVDDPEFQAILRKFIDGIPSRIQKMQEACKHEEWTKIQALAHSMKGAAMCFGYEHAGQIAHDIEATIKSGNIHNVPALLDKLSTGCQRLMIVNK